MIQRLKGRLAALEARQRSTTLIVRVRQFGEPTSGGDKVVSSSPDRVIYVTTGIPKTEADLKWKN
jgi:hypothetical protein